MSDFWLGMAIGTGIGFWAFAALAVVVSLGVGRDVPTVDGAHVADESEPDDWGAVPDMSWLDEADSEWLTQNALVRGRGES